MELELPLRVEQSRPTAAVILWWRRFKSYWIILGGLCMRAVPMSSLPKLKSRTSYLRKFALDQDPTWWVATSVPGHQGWSPSCWSFGMVAVVLVACSEWVQSCWLCMHLVGVLVVAWRKWIFVGIEAYHGHLITGSGCQHAQWAGLPVGQCFTSLLFICSRVTWSWDVI